MARPSMLAARPMALMVPSPSMPAELSMLAALSKTQPAKLVVPPPSMSASASASASGGLPAKSAAPLPSMPAGLNFAEQPSANSL